MKAVHGPVLAALVWALAPVGAAEEVDAGALAQRVRELREQVAAQPDNPEALFHADFLKAVPPAQLVGILQQYHAQGGKVVRATATAVTGEFAGEYRFVTDNGSSFPVKLAIDPAPPHRITGLWFGLMQPGVKGPEEVVEKLKALPGQVSFAFWRLGGEQPAALYAISPDLQLAIGSTFKLYVLGAVADGVARAVFRWQDVVPLSDKWKSWPSGTLQDWPDGSPVTLHTLATAMISVSDNTAADHLLFRVGRDKVEAVLGAMGHAEPARNVPFLSTREMFRIKEAGKSAERVAAWAKLDAAGRRAWLDGEIAALGRRDFAGIDQLRPTAIDGVEWFASAADLCRAMDWFRRRPEPEARAILAVNRGLEFDDAAWSYVGYKGGSEPGVLNLTWLLQRKDGAWFALSAGWNDAAASVDSTKLFALLQSFIEQVAQPPAVRPSSATP